uniref:RING-CH-type domain-containing protein n=1 Tax=Cucumis melo TaxID=3656 RepID=A0A9I9DLZ1_CUCME
VNRYKFLKLILKNWIVKDENSKSNAISPSGFHRMSAVEAPRGDSDPANPSSLPFRDARSAAGSCSDMSVLDDSDDQSWHSVFDSTAWGSHGEGQFSGEIEGVLDAEMGHFISESSSEVDLESGDLEVKVHLGKIERDCRICHLELESSGGRDNSDTPIQLGCCCRGDLGTAHKQCAETWFKIKGNTICEICGATAQNVASQQINEPSNAVAAAVASSALTAPLTLVETRTIFHGRRIMNFLLACMLLAFAMSWLFHFKLMS